MSFEDDVIDGSSPQEETNEQSADSAPVQESNESAPPQAKEDNVPFHLHPRFQEVIADKRALKEQNETFQRELAALREQVMRSQPKPQESKDELMERLKGIDPAFAERFGKISEVDALKAELAEIKSWREQTNAQTANQSVESAKEKFYSENKVPVDHREFYEAAIVMAARDPKVKISDLPQIMKQVNEKMSKFVTSTQRDATKQLVDGKKAAAAKPSPQPKGAPASAGKSNAPASKAEIRAQMVAETLNQIRAAKPDNF